VSVVCCQVEVSASGRSLVQRSPTECDVSEHDREFSIMRRRSLTRGCCAMREESESIDDRMYSYRNLFMAECKRSCPVVRLRAFSVRSSWNPENERAICVSIMLFR
jgi:hypothetical protein